MTQERLQKVMAQAGIASRRKCEEIILAGKVSVDGKVVTELGTKVDLGDQVVEVDGKPIKKERTVVLLLNKPRGVISTAHDPEGRQTVLDFVKQEELRVFPVGRLDYNTSGALLLTNDGELANALTHPKLGAPKKYLVKFRGAVGEAVMEKWKQGVKLEDGTRTRPVLDISRIEESEGGTWVHVAIKEGKNRQIRRMAEATGMQISKLKRVAFAGISIDNLPIGRYRHLTPKELEKLTADYSISQKDFVNNDKPTKATMPRRGKSASVTKPKSRGRAKTEGPRGGRQRQRQPPK